MLKHRNHLTNGLQNDEFCKIAEINDKFCCLYGFYWYSGNGTLIMIPFDIVIVGWFSNLVPW